MATTDVGAHKARARSGRLQRLAVLLGIVAVLLVLRDVLAPGMALPDAVDPVGPDPLPACRWR